MGDLLHGIDISKMMKAAGPVIKCVLLKAKLGQADAKQPAEEATKEDTKKDSEEPERVVLVDSIEEVEIDTTPQKQMVAQVLGGKFTFVGQYEDEGVVLMARNVEEIDPLDLPPFNTHVLQPPFDEHEIRGDILIMKVAPTEETLDEDPDATEVVVPTNDEFFLDYTKDEYVAFATRTDVVAPEPPEEESEDEGDEEDEEEEEYTVEDDGETDEEELTGMMNILMRTILRKFTEDNRRGPNTQELLNIRTALATKMGIEIADIPSLNEPVATKKRKTVMEPTDPASPIKSILTKRAEEEENDDDVEEVLPATKKVKFGEDTTAATVNVEKEEGKGD